MKLQDLLRKGEFDKMYEYIVKFDPYSEGNRFAYLAAYELLCNIKAEEGREYKVDHNYLVMMHDRSQEMTPVLCSGLEGSNWKKALGADMVLSPEAEIVPQDIISAVCLWHITYYGFTPEDQEEMFTAEQEEKKYQEIKNHEKEVEELSRILVGDAVTETYYVPYSPVMSYPSNLGKNNHKLLNTDAKDRMKKEMEQLDKMFEECCKGLK